MPLGEETYGKKKFSGEDKQKSVTDIGEAFLKYPGLPILERESVLKNAIAEGVQKGTFGLVKEGEVKYGETLPLEDIAEDALIIRKEEAEKLIERKEAPPAEAEEAKAVVEKLKEGVRKYTLKIQVPADKLSELVRGVFAPLIKDSAQISLKVEVEAESKEGIKKDTIDLKVKETLNQIGAKILEEKEE
jgi:hypothetical protein